MGPPLSHLVIGVREAGGAQTVTSYSIRMTRLPRIVTDGSVIESAVAPCEADDIDSCRQYFVVPVRAYDILQVTLERTGDNLTLVDPANGEVRSNGGRGSATSTWAIRRRTCGRRRCQGPTTRFISNVTSRVSAEYFCTLAHQAGSYTLAVVPGAFGGFGAELLTSAARWSSTRRACPACRVRGAAARLRVRHAAFQSGDIPGGARGQAACLWPDAQLHHQHHRCGRREPVRAGSGGNISDTCALRRLRLGRGDASVSPLGEPCTMRNATTWELQLSLADPTTATLDGLSPTEFVLSTQLQNATLAPGDTILPRSAGGRGYVCCGAVQSFMVPDVPRTSSLSIELNLTMGHVRAAFLKHGSCADPATDVDGALCKGVCEISWLTVYDEFYGTMEFTRQSSFNVPLGLTLGSITPHHQAAGRRLVRLLAGAAWHGGRVSARPLHQGAAARARRVPLQPLQRLLPTGLLSRRARKSRRELKRRRPEHQQQRARQVEPWLRPCLRCDFAAAVCLCHGLQPSGCTARKRPPPGKLSREHVRRPYSYTAPASARAGELVETDRNTRPAAVSLTRSSHT